MRALICGYSDPSVQPYIEPDQTENVLLRHRVCYYSVSPAIVQQEVVETKISPTDLANIIRGKVTDQVIATCTTLFGPGRLVKQDILFPDLSKG